MSRCVIGQYQADSNNQRNQPNEQYRSSAIGLTDDQEKGLFHAPYKLCLNGANRVQKSFYKRIGGVNTGILVVPFKFRQGDLFSDTAIGPYISYQWEVIELVATAGLSQISVSEVGTEEVESKTGLTGAFGVSFEIDTNWDIAILAGVDRLSGSDGDNWEYQGDVWWSFAIGFNFTRAD